jgi:hypothetical protein
VKIEIEINDKEQAESFMTWVKFRGDVTLGDKFDISKYKYGHDWRAAYVYIVSAKEIDDGLYPGQNS